MIGSKPSYVLKRLMELNDSTKGDILDVSGPDPVLLRHYGDSLYGLVVSRRQTDEEPPKHVWHFEKKLEERGDYCYRRLVGPESDGSVREMLHLSANSQMTQLEQLP